MSIKKFLLSVLLLASTSMVWALDVTEPPEIIFDVEEECVIITAEGEGEVCLYIDGELVDNPCYIVRGEEDVTVVVTATAQGEGMAISEIATMAVVIPALEETDPHENGYWIVLRDRFGRDVWYKLEQIDWGDGIVDHLTNLVLHYSRYGGYDPETTDWDEIPMVPLYIVIDGVRYGAQAPDKEAIYGNPIENLLVESDNCFDVHVGYFYTFGVMQDDVTGEKFLAVSRAWGPDSENPADYITGDVDYNAKVNIDDVTAMINYLLSGSVTPFNDDNADVDGSGRITIDDVTALINFLLSGRWW